MHPICYKSGLPYEVAYFYIGSIPFTQFPNPNTPIPPFSGLSSHSKTINVSPHMMHCYETLTHQKYYSIFH